MVDDTVFELASVLAEAEVEGEEPPELPRAARASAEHIVEASEALPEPAKVFEPEYCEEECPEMDLPADESSFSALSSAAPPPSL